MSAQMRPEAAVATRGTSNPFPPVWTLQNASEVALPAAAATAALREREAAVRWYLTIAWNSAVAANEAAAVELRSGSHPPTPPPRRARPPAVEAGSGRCGGDLPSCAVMMCESGGNLLAVNPHNRLRPAGKWQIITPTWNGYGGYATADQAPESVQDARAREIYAGGAGRGQWAC